MTTTALRTGAHEIRDGVRLLRPNPDIPYRDGAEERLWEIVKAATDISSDSTEMLEVAEGWAESYHTHPARANIVRVLNIPVDATVLEIGSGCGPITRYLGETGAQVDSVEPVLPRARVGRERTRDLPNVQVFCGNLEDVPPDPAYDLVVVVGVLEYVGNGGRDLEPYLQFLRECRSRLRPGGSLVLAIENKLGVKYLTGTAEDHSGRMNDSIEDYPRGTPARTFSATALVDLVGSAGFSPRLFGVFPDYKHTRVVLDIEGLDRTCPELNENLPVFPSRYAGTRSVRLASEERLWKEFVRDGVASHFANSLLVIGANGEHADVWPGDQLARYFSVNRRREYAATTTVRRLDDGIRFDRVYSPEPGPMIRDGVTTWSYVAGRSFLDDFAEADADGRRSLLRRWTSLVQQATRDEIVPMDAIPTNVIVTDAGELTLIDSEFHDLGVADRVILRGLFWLAVHSARTTPPERWAPAQTIGEVFGQVAALVGVEVTDDVLARLIESEASFQVAVTTQHLGPQAQALAEAALRRICETNVWDTSLGRRLHNQYDLLVAERETLKEALGSRLSDVESQQLEIARLRRAVRKSRSRAKKAERDLAALKGSRTFRVAKSVRRGLARVGSLVPTRTSPH